MTLRTHWVQHYLQATELGRRVQSCAIGLVAILYARLLDIIFKGAGHW